MDVKMEGSRSEDKLEKWPKGISRSSIKGNVKCCTKGDNNCHRLGPDTLCSPGETHQECWVTHQERSPCFPSGREIWAFWNKSS